MSDTIKVNIPGTREVEINAPVLPNGYVRSDGVEPGDVPKEMTTLDVYVTSFERKMPRASYVARTAGWVGYEIFDMGRDIYHWGRDSYRLTWEGVDVVMTIGKSLMHRDRGGA